MGTSSPAVGAEFFGASGVTMLHHYWDQYTSLAGVAPLYLADDCLILSDCGGHSLRSSSNDIITLVISRTHNKFGDRSFSAVGPVRGTILTEPSVATAVIWLFPESPEVDTLRPLRLMTIAISSFRPWQFYVTKKTAWKMRKIYEYQSPTVCRFSK